MDFLAVDPGQKITIELPGYPNGHPPITCKHMTSREWRAYRALWRSIDGSDEERDATRLREMFAVADLLIGDKPGEEWDDILNDTECSFVLDAIADAHLPNRERRKNFDSPSQSDTGSHAPSPAAAIVSASSNVASAAEVRSVEMAPSAQTVLVVA